MKISTLWKKSDEDEQPITMIVCRLNNMFKSKRFNPKKIYKKGSKRMRELQKIEIFLIMMNLIQFFFLLWIVGPHCERLYNLPKEGQKTKVKSQRKSSRKQ